MTVTDALNEIARKLQDLDRRQLLCGRPRLFEEDWTWQERTMELAARVNLLAADGPSQEVLDALGAHVVAYKRALAEAEGVRVDTGSEAA